MDITSSYPPEINFLEMFIHNIKIHRYLRDQYTVSICSYTSSKSSVTSITSEDLYDHYPVMGLSCCLYIPDIFGYFVGSGITTNRVGLKVKIHCFGSMDTWNSMLCQIYHYTSGIITTGDNQGIDIVLFQTFQYFFIKPYEMICIHKVVQTGISMMYYICPKPAFDSHTCSTHNDRIKTATVSSSCKDTDIFHSGHDINTSTNNGKDLPFFSP